MLISEAFRSFQYYYLVNESRSQKTQQEYIHRFHGRNGVLAVIGDVPMHTIALDHVVHWKVHMREEQLQTTYINHCLSGFRTFLKWCGENEIVTMDWQKITPDKDAQHKPKVALTPAEVQRLVDCAPSLRDKAAIRLFFGTGLRSAELIGLDRSDWEGAELVDPRYGVWQIYVEGKNKKYRPVCFYQDVKDAVDMYLNSRQDRYRPLFISQQNRRVHHNTLGRVLHLASRKAGLEKRVTQHVLRHSYTSESAGNGMPVPILSYQLGHADPSVTMKIYTHINSKQSVKSYAEFGPRIAKAY